MEGIGSDEERAPSPPHRNGVGASPTHKVRFSPSAASGSTLSSSPPTVLPRTSINPGAVPPVPPPPHPVIPNIPSLGSSPPSGSPPRTRGRKASVSSQEREYLPHGFVPHGPPTGPPLPPPPTGAPMPPPPPPGPPMPPSPPHRQPHHSPINYHPAPPPHSSPPPPFQLTPSIIAKAQKHCRFAISSLDYEDAEQARKELRAALAALGG
ncbi:hypothetical protein BV22DRAFT_931776 [Leucogyrophana mollusca]|uniref:Uncharacterized protein n=1 Tax=Leucogyrophana mollusca TaxID=85980 RepID=A0ACB8AW32_9AGAM|nr:hypothetical protein BV22DRAFT_931776 [Leucogyrophana mollusca]